MIKELEAIVSKLKEERAMLNRAMDQLSDEQTENIIITDQWSVKDVIAHLAGAERGMTRMAQLIAKGEDPQLPEGYNNDEYNARQVAKRKAQSLADIRAELDSTRAECYALLESVTAEQLVLMGEHPLAGEIALKDLLVVIYNHEIQHCNEISNKVGAAKK